MLHLQKINLFTMKKLIFGLMTFTLSIAFAQKSGIQGKITSKQNPILANIKVKNQNTGTSTNLEGEYKLLLSPGKYTLVVSAIGYKNQELNILINKANLSILDINLKEDILGLDKVVVTATRGYLNRKKAPVIVTVTDQKVLEATQAVSLSEGLNFQPGLRMENNCQNCGTSEIKMNGLSGSYTQVLIDSRPIFSALNSIYGLDQIPANIIKQIEVVRGGGSALYGSNAIAGTINIITKDPSENSFSIGSNLALIDGESFDRTLTFNGTLVNENYDSGIALFGIKRARNSYDADGDGFTELTKLENTSFGLKAFTRPNDRKKITAEFNANNEFRRGGNQLNLLSFLADVTEEINSSVVSGGLTYEYLSPNNLDNFSTYTSTSFSKNDNFYGGLNGENQTPESIETSIDGFGSSKDITIVAGTQYAHKFHNIGTFTSGLEYRYNFIDDRKENDDYEPIIQTTHLTGLYAQQEWTINNHFKILGGLRADAHNLAEEAIVINPRANILYTLSQNLRLRASYAKGFRAPQVYGEDIHSGLAGGKISRVINAANLKSETSHSFLTSLDWNKELTDGEIAVTTELFYTKLNDAFALEKREEEFDDIFVWERINSTGAKVYGANIELKYAPNEKWLLQTGATLQRSLFDDAIQWSEDSNVAPTREFNKTPNLYGNFILNYNPTEKFENNLSGVYTGKMHIQHIKGFINQDTLETSNSFFELNWKSSYMFKILKNNTLNISGGIQNIFNAYQNDFDQGIDRDVAYVYGPQRPRTFFLGIKFGY